MKGLFRNLILTFTLVFSFTALRTAPVSAVELSAPSQITLQRLDDGSERSLSVRFSENIPYIKLSEFYHALFSQNITITKTDSELYTVTTRTGQATIDTSSDTLSSSNYTAFIATPEPEETMIPIIVKGFNDQFSGETIPTNIDFSKYEIDLQGEETDIWLPYQTLTDIFLKPGFYDGTKLYTADELSSMGVSTNSAYRSLINYYFQGDNRFSNYIRYSYNELCLALDFFYGLPERSVLSQSIKEHGLDYTLENYDEDTRKIKQLLLSDNLKDFYQGFALLGAYLYDGGHTSFEWPLSTFYIGLTKAGELAEGLDSYARYAEVNEEIDAESAKNSAITSARNGVLDSENYAEQGDTAIFAFDDFDYDESGWQSYYADSSSGYPNDTLGKVLKALDKASKNSEIKNFVFDLSKNGGGLGFTAQVIMAHLGYDNSLKYRNTINNQIEETIFKVDTNHDNVYTDEDKISKYNFNYGVLTSGLTFSTANMFASLAEDNGFMILGEKSGGGTCSIKVLFNTEGMGYTYSSSRCLANAENQSIDAGIAVDANLVIVENGENNYSEFYDLTTLGSLLNEYYSSDSDDSSDEPSDSSEGSSGSSSSKKSNKRSGKKSSNKASKEKPTSSKETENEDSENTESGNTTKTDISSSKNSNSNKQTESNQQSSSEDQINILPIIISVAVIAIIFSAVLIRKNKK